MDETTFVPWDAHPGLSEKRLRIIAGMIRKARSEVVALYEPSKGDTSWDLGCRAYSRSRFRIIKAVSEYAWLKMIEDDGHLCTFAVEGVPMRIYRGESDDPPQRSLRQRYPELHAIQTSFSFMEGPEHKFLFRIAVETDDLGEARDIYLVQVNKNEQPLAKYRIPDDREATTIAFVRQVPPVPVPPASVGPPTVRTKKPKDGE